MSSIFIGHWPKYKLPVAFVMILAVVFITIILTGCSTSSVSNPHLYLLEFAYNSSILQGKYQYGLVPDQPSSSFKVRAAYFSICINSGSNGSWVCSPDCKWLKSQGRSDVLNLLNLACRMRTEDFSPWPFIISLVAALITVLLVLVLSSVTFLTTLVCTMASVFCLLSMTWQQSSTNSIKSVAHTVSQEFVIATSGLSLAGLGWSSFILQCLIGICLAYELISYSISDRFSVDEEKTLMDNTQHQPPDPARSERGRSRSRHSFPSPRPPRSRSASVDY